MSDDNQGHNVRLHDITAEVNILDFRPKFTGNYSDVYIGTLRGQLVRRPLRWECRRETDSMSSSGSSEEPEACASKIIECDA